MGVQLKMGVQLNRSLFNLLRTDLIVDFEGYFVDKKFIIKEIAFFNYYLNTYDNFFIKTQNYYNKETQWCINHYHKIPCNYGNVSFSLINKIFQNPYIVFLCY